MTVEHRTRRTTTRSAFVRRTKEAAVYAVWPEIRKYLGDLRFYEDAASDQVVAIQLEKLNSLLRHFQRVDPVFRDLSARGVTMWRLNSLCDLKQFPIITKEILRSYEADLKELPYVARRGSTSGSTGRNFTFLQSRSMVRARTAAVRHCYERIGIDYWSDPKIVIWGGRSPYATRAARLRVAVKRWFLNSRTCFPVRLDDRTARTYLEIIASARPALIEGYPSYLAAVAKVGLEGTIYTRSHAPRAVVTTAEQLHDSQRTTLAEWFASRVFNRYGSCEFGVIAQEMPGLQGLWVPPTRFVIEQTGDNRLLVTDLDNYAFPFIRYEIGDCGTLNSEFAGPQILTELHGRLNDIIRTPSGRLLSLQFWGALSRTVSGIEEFQVVQTHEDRVELRVVTTARFRSPSHSLLVQRFRQIVGREMELVVREVPEIAPTVVGKRRTLIGLERGSKASL